MPPLEGGANDLAQAVPGDALLAGEAVVGRGVAHQHRPAVAQHRVGDRAADDDLAADPARGPGREFAGLGVGEQHDAVVRVGGLERQLHDAAEQLVDIQNAADRVGRLVERR